MTEMKITEDENQEEKTCECCSCWECNGTGVTEWKETCDCTYMHEHTFGNRCMYERMSGAFLVLKHPAEIIQLGIGVPSDIFLGHIIPFVCDVNDEEE
jgi:hypothetical protein